MKILLSNKFYYNRGGDCTYTLNLQHLLEKHGHEVAIFAMNYPQNFSSPWQKYFPSEINFKPGSKMFEAMFRPLGTQEVSRKFSRLLDDFRPDILHLNNIHSQLSPVIAEIAHRRGIRVVWTLHDYKMFCPRYDCLRGGRENCTSCMSDTRCVIRNRCMKGSWAGSLLGFFEIRKWNRRKLDECTDCFICPSQFMNDRMQEWGIAPEKLVTLNNFIDTERCEVHPVERQPYYCYVGRLSPEKGLPTLIDAASALPYPLKIVGGGPLSEILQERTRKLPHIEFLGHRTWEEVKEIVRKAQFLVIPSEWYENNPFSIIEALCLGTPILGADIGGIPELIREGVNGLLFEPKSVQKLQQRIGEMMKLKFDNDIILKQAQQRFNAEAYLNKLMSLYK